MIPHSKPLLDDAENHAILAVMARGDIAVGPEIEAFERAVALSIGRQHAVATTHGTAAMHMALLALGIGAGDEVLLPASVCPGVMHAIEYTGATPVFLDTNRTDLNLSAHDAQQMLTKKTRAIIVPHLFGIPSAIEPLLALGLPIIEDCAQSLGARYRGKPTGAHGVLSVFSFYATKMLTSIDGGMVLTDDDAYAARMRDLRYYSGKKNYALRYNYKMQNINAAVGLVQLHKLDHFLHERRRLHAWLTESLQRIAGLHVLGESTADAQSCHYKLLLNFDTPQQKNAALAECRALEIITAPPAFVDLASFRDGPRARALPNLQWHMDHTLVFPIYPGIDTAVLQQWIDRMQLEAGV